MNAATIPLWVALLIQIGLGLAVYRANSRNHANQSFLIVSVFISAWLVSLQFAFNADRSGAQPNFGSGNSCASGVLIVNGFNLLRLGILCRDGGWREIGRRLAPLAVPSLAAD